MRAPSSDPTTPSFEELYASTFGFVTRTLRRLGVDDCGLDDAIQDVYLVVHRRLDTFEGRSAPATWVYGIARRVAADHRRREHRLPEPVEEIEVEARDNPYEELATAQGRAQLERLLGELPEDRREVFVLAEIEELSGPEIARCLDLDVETVYWRLKKGRLEWSSALERYSARETWRAQRGGRGDRDRARRRRCWTALVVALSLPARKAAAASAVGASFGYFAASGVAVATAVAVIVAATSPTARATTAAPVAAVSSSVAPTPMPVIQPLASARPTPPAHAPRSPSAGASLRRADSRPPAAIDRAARREAREVANVAPPADDPAATVIADLAPAPTTADAKLAPATKLAPAPTTVDANLAAEAALLLAADEALRRGALDEAGASLEAHARRFPAAVLVRERETLEIARRCLAGDRDGVDAAIDELARRHPSPSARQTLRRACGLDR